MTNTSSVMDQTTLIKVIEQYLTFSDNTSVIEFIRWIKRRLKLADISSVKEPGLSSMSKVSNHSGVINTSQLFICRCGHRYSLRFSMTDFLNDNNNNNNPLSSPYYNSSEQDCNDIDNNIVSDDDDGNLGGINEQNITNEPCSPNNGGRASRRKLSKPVRKDLATIQQSQQQVDTTNKDLTSNSPPNRSATSVGSRESDSANELSPNEIKRKYQKQSEDKLQKNTSKIARDVPIIHSKQRQNSVESKINRPPLVYHKPNHHSVSSFRHRCLRCGVLFRRRSSLARHRLRPCSNHQLLSSNVQIQKQIYSNNSHSVFHHRKHRSQQLSSFFICSYCSIRLYSREQFLNHESMHQKGYYYCKKCFEFFIPTYDNGQLKSHGCSESRKLAERTLLNAFAINEQTTNSVIEKNKTLIDREQVNDFLDNDVASVEDGTTLTIQEEQKDIIVSTQQNSIHQKQHDYNETDEHLEELKGLEQLIPPDTDSGELMINNDDDIDEAFDMNDEDEQITAKNNVGQVRNNSMGTMGEGERNQLNNLYQNDEINGKSPSVDDFNDQSAAARITRFGLPKLTDSVVEVLRADGKRQYRCPLCLNSYANRSGLNRHYITHSSQELWKVECKYCGKRYSRKDSLKHHMKTQHGQHTLADVIETSSASMSSFYAKNNNQHQNNNHYYQQFPHLSNDDRLISNQRIDHPRQAQFQSYSQQQHSNPTRSKSLSQPQISIRQATPTSLTHETQPQPSAINSTDNMWEEDEDDEENSNMSSSVSSEKKQYDENASLLP